MGVVENPLGRPLPSPLPPSSRFLNYTYNGNVAFVPSYAVQKDPNVTAARVLKYEKRMVRFVVDDDVKATMMGRVLRGFGEGGVMEEWSSMGGQLLRMRMPVTGNLQAVSAAVGGLCSMLVVGWWPVKSQQWNDGELPAATAGDVVMSATFHQATGWLGVVHWGSVVHAFTGPRGRLRK